MPQMFSTPRHVVAVQCAIQICRRQIVNVARKRLLIQSAAILQHAIKTDRRKSLCWQDRINSNISSMCWNGKYAIDLCALVLYSNISSERRNKRGPVCHARGATQYNEDSNFMQSVGFSLFIILGLNVYLCLVKELNSSRYIWAWFGWVWNVKA